MAKKNASRPRPFHAKSALITLGVNIIGTPFALLFIILRPIKDVRFVELIDNRIGHLAGNTELFLRRIDMGIIPDGRSYIGLATTQPSNEQVLRLIERRLHVIRLPIPLFRIMQTFSRKPSLLRTFGIIGPLWARWNEFEEFGKGRPQLSFTAAEKRKGESLLKELGLSKRDWYVCVHTRDSAYLDLALSREGTPYQYRDCDIMNYLPAMEYIAQQGGCAIRMGAVVEKPLPETGNAHIIDYATTSRSDFGDAYLPSKCKFFLGNTAGIFLMATIFNRPVAFANMVPIGDFSINRPGDIIITKKIYSKRRKRFLTIKEIFAGDLCHYHETRQYEKAGLVCVENTAEEILDLCVEMQERIDGIWKESPEDEKLQKIFRSYLTSRHPSYGFPARIGTNFLRKNRNLLQ